MEVLFAFDKLEIEAEELMQTGMLDVQKCAFLLCVWIGAQSLLLLIALDFKLKDDVLQVSLRSSIKQSNQTYRIVSSLQRLSLEHHQRSADLARENERAGNVKRSIDFASASYTDRICSTFSLVNSSVDIDRTRQGGRSAGLQVARRAAAQQEWSD
jgi:hypothetical protein